LTRANGWWAWYDILVKEFKIMCANEGMKEQAEPVHLEAILTTVDNTNEEK